MRASHRDTPAGGGADAFGRSLDRAVCQAWFGRILGLLGGWLGMAAIIILALALLDLATGGRIGSGGLPAVLRGSGIAVAAGLLATAVFRRRWSIGQRPNRLAVALATEQHAPWLGERLSRAVEFLTDTAAPDPPEPYDPEPGPSAAVTTQALRHLAVEQAAEAARGIGRLSVPGITADLRLLAAGIALPAALWLSALTLPDPWADAVRRQLFGRPPTVTAATTAGHVATESSGSAVPIAAGPSDSRPATADRLPPAWSRAAAGIRAAAVFEQRMAALLSVLFARAPGLPTRALPREACHELEQLALAQAECHRTVVTDREALVRAAESAAQDSTSPPMAAELGRAVARLADLDQFASETAPLHIAANRLGLAGGIVADTAAILADAADALGMPPSPDAGQDRGPSGVTDTAAADRNWRAGASPVARATRVLDRISAAHRQLRPDQTQTLSASAAGMPGTVTVDGEPTSPTADTTDPRFGPTPSGPPQTATLTGPEPTTNTPIERVWSLMPTAAGPEAARESFDGMPAAYRPAIDAYYRLLLQSFPDSPPDPFSAPFPAPFPDPPLPQPAPALKAGPR